MHLTAESEGCCEVSKQDCPCETYGSHIWKRTLEKSLKDAAPAEHAGHTGWLATFNSSALFSLGQAYGSVSAGRGKWPFHEAIVIMKIPGKVTKSKGQKS